MCSDMDLTVNLQITPCLPLLPSRRTSPPFGWYSFYHPTEGRRLSRPGWLVIYRNKVPPPGVDNNDGAGRLLAVTSRQLVPRRTPRRPRAGPATDCASGDRVVCRSGVRVTFRDSAVPETSFRESDFPGNVRKP